MSINQSSTDIPVSQLIGGGCPVTDVAQQDASGHGDRHSPIDGDGGGDNACPVLHTDTKSNYWARLLSKSTDIVSVKVYERQDGDTSLDIIRRRCPGDYDVCDGFDDEGFSLAGADGKPVDQWIEDKRTGLRYDVRSLNPDDIAAIEANTFNAYLSKRCPLEVKSTAPFTIGVPHPVYEAYSIVIDNLTKQGASVRPTVYRGGKKQAITGYSKKSEENFKALLETCGIRWKSVLTVTFGDEFPMDGQEARRIFMAIRNALQRHLGERAVIDGFFTYAWCREFQTKRKAIHWHILLSCEVTANDIRWWAKWWSSYQGKVFSLSDEAIEKVYRFNSLEKSFFKGGKQNYPVWENERVEGALPYYIAKYVSKGEQKTVPEGFTNPGRFWGVSDNVKPKQIGEIDLAAQSNLDQVAQRVAARELANPSGEVKGLTRRVLEVDEGDEFDEVDEPLSFAELSYDEVFIREVIGSYRPEFLDLGKTPVLRRVVWGCPPVDILEGLEGFRYGSGEVVEKKPIELEIGPFRGVL